MSADNGIYILQTPKGNKFEFRVAHLQAVENFKWDDVNKEYTNDQNVWIENARNMWKDCNVFTNKSEAFQESDKIYYNEIMNNDYGILEYGICTIEINKEF